jgi:peptide/nickel transport system ATP-binding protein
VLAQAVLRILPRNASIDSGEVWFADPEAPGARLDLAKLRASGRQMRALRGGRISMVFQEPMSSLSPLHTIGDQVGEALRLHRRVGRAAVRAYRAACASAP